MILVLRPGASEAEVAEVLQELERRGCTGSVLRTGTSSVVHVTGGRSRRARKLRALEQVVEIVPTSWPRVRREGWRFYPYHFVNWSAFGVVLLGVLVFLAGMLPTGIGEPVDYRHPPEAVAQPWYLRAPLALVHAFPSSLWWLGWVLLGLAALALFFLPLLDRTPRESAWGPHLRRASALVLVLAVAWTVWKGAGA